MKTLEKKNIAILTIFAALFIYIVGHLYFILKEETPLSASSDLASTAFSVPNAPLEKVKAVYYEQFLPEKKAFEKLNQQNGVNAIADSTLNLKSILETSNNAKPDPPKHNIQKKTPVKTKLVQQPEALNKPAFKRRLVAAVSMPQPDYPSGIENKMSFEALVFGTQQIQSGGQIKLLLNQDINLAGYIIPKNTFIYPVLHVDNEYLSLSYQLAGLLFEAKIDHPSAVGMLTKNTRALKKQVLNESVNQVSRLAGSRIPFVSGISSAISLVKDSKNLGNTGQTSFPNKMKLRFIQQ